jgi:hypothetical protein
MYLRPIENDSQVGRVTQCAWYAQGPGFNPPEPLNKPQN